MPAAPAPPAVPPAALPAALPDDLLELCLARVPPGLSGKVALVSRRARERLRSGDPPAVRFDLLASRDELLWAVSAVDWENDWSAAAASAGLAASGDVGLLRLAWKASGGRLDLHGASVAAAERGHVNVLAWADFVRTRERWEGGSRPEGRPAGQGESPDDRLARDVLEAAARGNRAAAEEYAIARYGAPPCSRR